MKGKISKKGFLSIERADTIKPQDCPRYEDNPCGDWCPLFGEPYYNYVGSERANLTICKANIAFVELIDEREME